MRTGYLATTIGSIAFITACGSHLQRTKIGGGTASVQARNGFDGAPATSVAVERGTYEVKMLFDVPRAQVIEWTVLCPGAAESGIVGETTEQYRTRRIAELRAERQRERGKVAAISGMAIAAVAPDVSAHAHASGPHGHAHAEATVPGEVIGAVAGQAIADATVGDPHAEARARAATDPKARARVVLQMRLREDALVTRNLLVEYLTGECNARPDHREYLREQPLLVRAALKDYLVSLGARLRPPRPAPLPEDPGTSPYDDGVWVSGEWTWTGLEWSWSSGGWRDNAKPVVRDHRTSSGSDNDNWPSNTRDHRTESKSESKRDDTPVVRDHRDKNDDKKKDDDNQDSAPRVRDHRR
jgi:hypothetical protein